MSGVWRRRNGPECNMEYHEGIAHPSATFTNYHLEVNCHFEGRHIVTEQNGGCTYLDEFRTRG